VAGTGVPGLFIPAPCPWLRYYEGEDLCRILISVNEGEDKPPKYSTIVNSAEFGVVTRADWVGSD